MIGRTNSGGFSLIEILVIVAIVALLAAVALLSLTAMRDRLVLNDAESAIAFHLEESKARSVAGTGGVEHGIYFEDHVYTQFVGAAYDDEDEENVVYQLDPRLELVTDILDSEKSVVFSRITGAVGENVMLTIRLSNDPLNQRTIRIGTGGDISYE